MFYLLIFWEKSLAVSLDTLQKIVSDPTLSVEAKVEKLISFSRIDQGYLNKAAENAIALAAKTNNKNLLANTAKEIAKSYYKFGDLGNALEYFKQALKLNTEIKNSEEIAANYNNLGLVYNKLGYYDMALQSHLNQLKINEETENLKGIAASHLNIGNIYLNMRDYDNAFEHYQISKKILEKTEDNNTYSSLLINLGIISTELQNFSQAENFFNEALSIKLKLNDFFNIAAIHTNLGLINLKQNKFDDALPHFQKSLAIYDSLDNKQGVATSLLNIGELYLQQGKMNDSYTHLTRALEIAQSIDAKKLIYDIKNTLVNWYEQKGDFKNALHYLRDVMLLNDSLLSLEKTKQVRNLQIIYEVEKKEKEILEKTVAIERLKTRQIYFWVVILAVFSLALVLFYRYRIKKKLNKQLEIKIEEAIRKQNEQQQVIVHQASLTSLGELASGIAHEIKQPLQSITLATESIQLENKEKDPDREFIHKTINDIKEDIKRIKLIINEIGKFSRGQQLDISELFDINDSIEKSFILARTRFSDQQIKVEFDLDRSIPKITGNPYKFEQVMVNFLTNARDAIEEKFAKGGDNAEKFVKVKSSYQNGHIVIEVIDNGIGIPDEVKSKIFLPFYTTKTLGKGTGLGLSISQSIVKEMGGTIEVESREGIGTVMRLKLPVPGSSGLVNP